MSGWNEIFKGLCLSQNIESRMLAEIQTAIDADLQGRKIPPLHFTSIMLKGGHCESIPKSAIEALADFLANVHRGQRGHKKDRACDRQVDIDRTLLYFKLVDDLGDASLAKEQMEQSERIDVRSVERSLKRGMEYLREDKEKLETELLELKFMQSSHATKR